MFDLCKEFNEQILKEKERLRKAVFLNAVEANMLANVRKYYGTIFKNSINDIEFLAEILANLNYNMMLVKTPAISKSCKIGSSGDISKIEGGALYISFHYGLYCEIPFLFYEAGIPIATVAANPSEFPVDEHNIQNLFAGDPLLFVDIKKKLKKGISVILYVDAITSSPKITVTENFGDNIISLKTSVFKFCSTLSEKVYMIISDGIDNNHLLFNIYDLNNNKNMGKHENCKNIAAKAFAILEQRVLKKPSMWLSWQIPDLFVKKDKAFATRTLTKVGMLKVLFLRHKNKFRFNSESFILYEKEEEYYIMNVFSDRTIRLNEIIAKALLMEDIYISKLEKIMNIQDFKLLVREQILK